MRFQRRFGLDTSLPSDGKARSYQSLAENLKSFAGTANRIGAEMSQQQARIDAGNVEPSTEAPALRSPGTVYGQQYNQIVTEGHVAATQNDYRMQIQQLAQANPADPSTFAKSAEAVKLSILNNVAPRVRGVVSNDFDRVANSHTLEIQRNQAKLSTQAALAEVTMAFDASHDAIMRDIRLGDEKGAYDSAAVYKAAVQESTSISPEEKAKRLRAIDRGFVEQALLADLENVSLREGYALLDSVAGDIPEGYAPDEWDKFVSKAQAELGKRSTRESKLVVEQEAVRTREVGNLEIAINTGQGDMVEQVDQINRLFDSGQLSESKRVSLLTKVYKQAQDAQEDADVAGRLTQRLEGDKSVLVEQAEVDKAYANIAKSFDGPDANAQKANLVSKLGVLPKLMSREITNGLRSGDPKMILSSVDLMDRVMGTPGVQESAFPPDAVAFAEKYTELAGYLPPEQAMEKARLLTDPTDKVRRASRQAIIDTRKPIERVEHYADEFDDRFDDIYFGSLENNIEKQRLAAKFQSLSENFILSGLDPDAAEDKAEKAMRGTVVKSAVTGKAGVMKNAPELFYSVGDDQSWMHEQLKSEVTAKLGVEPEAIHVLSDERTDREASTGKPTYNVMVMTDQGLEPVFGARWAPDPSAAKAAMIKKNEDAMIAHKEQISKITPPARHSFKELTESVGKSKPTARRHPLLKGRK